MIFLKEFVTNIFIFPVVFIYYTNRKSEQFKFILIALCYRKSVKSFALVEKQLSEIYILEQTPETLEKEK